MCLVFYVIFFHFLINFIFYSLIFYLLLQAKADRKSSSHKFFFGIGFSLIRLLFKRTRRRLINCRGKNKCTYHYCSLACFLPRHFSEKWESLRINIVCFWEVFYLPESELLPGRMEYLDKAIEQSVKYATLLLHFGINKNLLQLLLWQVYFMEINPVFLSTHLYLFVPNQLWKHQKNAQYLFIVKNKDIRTLSLTSIGCRYW